jgi:hypothetical protein
MKVQQPGATLIMTERRFTMDNIQVFLTLILLRLVIPVGILITLGEWERQREANYRSHNEHLTDSFLQSSVPL